MNVFIFFTATFFGDCKPPTESPSNEELAFP
jgi:hypothetical protein